MPREHLVVVLPGIGGSVLAEPGSLDEPVWAAGAGDVLDLLTQPEELDINRELVPAGLIPSLRVFPFWTPIVGYDRLLSRLAALPDVVLDPGRPEPGRRVAGANVVAFPYDFRRSVAAGAERLDALVRSRLAELWPAEYPVGGDREPGEGARPRVVLVAHSMGGLVARYWLAQPGNWRLCRTLITLGTPHRGAPKALEVLAHGIPVGKGRVRLSLPRPAATLRGWPGAFELLPRYPMIQLTGRATPTDPPDAGPSATGQDAADAAGRLLRHPHELSAPSWEWLTTGAAQAWTVHRAIEDGWKTIPREGTDVVARIGYGHGTFQTARWDGSRLTVATDAAPEELIGAWRDDRGDGTVPAISGLPLEMSNSTGIGLRVNLTHPDIINLDEVLDIVEAVEHRRPLTYMHGDDPDPEHPVVLGVDVEDVVVRGEPMAVGARIVGTPEDTSRVQVFATLARLDSAGRPIPGTTTETGLVLDTAGGGAVVPGGWSGEVSPGPAGAYLLRVSADAVPLGGSPSTERVVQVVDPEAAA